MWEVCWGSGRDEWRIVGGMEKCDGYITICDDLMRGRTI